MGKGRSHAGKYGVRGTAIAKKALREKQNVKVKEKAKSESKKGVWKKEAYIARAGGKTGNPRQNSIKVKNK